MALVVLPTGVDRDRDLFVLLIVVVVVLAFALGWIVRGRRRRLKSAAASISRPPSPNAVLPCPLCLEQSGHRVTIVAEYDLSTPIVTVVDLTGCPHAARFGEIGGLAVDEERRLIEAALDAWDARQRDEDEGEAGGRPGPRRCA